MNLDEAIQDMNNKGIQFMRLVGKAKPVLDYIKILATTIPLAVEGMWLDDTDDHTHDGLDLMAVTYPLVFPIMKWRDLN